MHMNRYLSLGFICSLLLISLAGFCVAEEAPSYLIYVQGGESSITDGTDGAYEITVKNIVPYFYITNGEKSSLIPVVLLPNMTYPMNAALVFSGEGNETTFMVQVAYVSLSDGNKILTLQADHLEYYEGEMLKSFNDKREDFNVFNDGRFISAGVYLESEQLPTSNNDGEDCSYGGDQGGDGSPCTD